MLHNMDEDIPIKRSRFSGKLPYIIAIIFVVTLVLVGVLSGVLSASKARKSEKEKYVKQIQEMLKDDKTTIAPTTITPSSEITTRTAAPSTPKQECNEVWCNVRLPTTIRPDHYNLEIESYPEELKYNGTVTIEMNVTKPTTKVLIHTKDNHISGVALKKLGTNTNLEIESSFEYKENEYYVINSKNQLDIGQYVLTVLFQSNVSKTLTGFYNSSYTQDGNTSVLLTTKFQPTDARRAFPCFDEPDLKSTFTVTMIYPKKYHARSNMQVETPDVEIGGDMIKRRFKKTVVMSTYLVCFIVSEFTMKFNGTSGRNNTVDLAIWSRPDFVNATEYAYNASSKMLSFLEKFLEVPYSLPKLDMYAIPDYGSGATEHWGIITYRETRLLYFEGTSSFANKQSTAAIIAHECAHLWFGNLVTCKWWNDLWVQEGMASYLEYYAQDHVHPEWKMMDEFLSVDWNTGMTLDALTSSHPISQPVNHPKQIKEIFDSITYNKGSSLFHMLDVYLGQDVFKACLKDYLLTHQYKGATVDDLWNSFSKVSGLNINEIMNTWTKQMGFPVVTIAKDTGTKFTLTQKHFLIDSKAKVTTISPYNYIWQIPFVYVPSNDKSNVTKMILKDRTTTLQHPSDYIIGNYNHGGFYRVNYDNQTWYKIINQMKQNASVFTVKDRAGILDDSFKLAQADYIAYDIPLAILKALENDTSSLTWSFVFKNLGFIDSVLNAQESYTDLRRYMRKALSRFLQPGKKIKYLYTGCKYSHPYAIEYSNRLFKDWMQNGTAIPVDVRSTVYSCGVMHGGDKEWEFVFKNYLSNNNPTEKSKLQSALSLSSKPWIITKWLQYSLDPNKVRTQDTVYVIGAVASNNPVGKYIAFNFVAENWLKIMSIAKENNFHTAVITSRITKQFTTSYDLEQVESLWRKYPDAGSGANARKQGIEKIKSKIAWLEKNYETITKWLKSI